MSNEETGGEDDVLEGERGLPSVNTTRRKDNSTLFKLAIVAAVVIGALVLLARAFAGHERVPQTQTAKDEVGNTLPAMPEMPEIAPPPAPDAERPTARRQLPAATDPQGMTSEQTLMARRQRAPILAYGAGSGAGGAGAPGGLMNQALSAARPGGGLPVFAAPAAQSQSKDDLAEQLKPTSTSMAKASVLPDRNLLITKGTFLDCALETAIDSTVSGFVTCRLTRNVYSDNGHVLLLERGSRVVGQYQSGQMRPGMRRIFVLWNRIETPNGVVVNLDSPGTDPLGRSGLPGLVDKHFFERFGAALMLSLIDDYVKYETAKQQGGSGNQLQFSGTTSESQRLAEIALSDSINIPPTLYKNQGDHINIFVARDIDFSDVYGLERKPHR